MEKKVTLVKMGHTRKKKSHLQKWVTFKKRVTLVNMGHTCKNGTHLEKRVTFDSLNQMCLGIHMLADKREPPVRIVLPYKYQKSANVVQKQLADLSRKINVYISPAYTSRKIKDEIKVREDKPPLVSQQCVVYSFQYDLCDAGYVGYTCRHLH